MPSPLWKWFRRYDDFRIYIGIDPGTTGAVAFMACPDQMEIASYRVVDIPTLTVTRGRKKGTVPNHQAVIQLFTSKYLRPDRVYVSLEKPPPQMGPQTRYSDVILGHFYAMWPLFLLSKGFRLTEVPPAAWKKALKIGREKDDARRKALEWFPKADILRKKDHNRAEGLLLAEYLRRTHVREY
jgi:hypothetical protein